MKKNWIMKVAAGMLGLTMITASFVGSTFAKYVTKAQGHDHARVAAWGVLIDVEGKVFANKYEAQDQDYIDAHEDDELPAYSVVSRGGNVVAPGTGSANLGTNLKATVIGTPEVAARYTIKGENIDDVCLPAGTYTDFTEAVPTWDHDGSVTYGYTNTFELEKNYTPIKWNLVISKGSTTYNLAEALYDALPDDYLAAAQSYGLTRSGCSFFDAIDIIRKVAGSTLYTQIVEEVLGNMVSGGRNFKLSATTPSHTDMHGGGLISLPGSFELSYDFDPIKEMDFTFELTWEWAFEQIDDPENPDPAYTALYDKADTFLGNCMAYYMDDLGDPNDPTSMAARFPELDILNAQNPHFGASIWINADLTATATQID